MPVKKMNGKPFAVFDIDGTLIRWQLYHAVSDALVELGYFDSKLFEPVRAARKAWKQRLHEESFLAYEHKLVSAFNQLITSLTKEQFIEAIDLVFDEYKDQVYRYTRDLIVELKKQGYFMIAISGSPNEIVEKVAHYHKFDAFVGSTFVHKNGRYTGDRVTPFGRKHEILQELMHTHDLTLADSVAVGDSEGDTSMLEMVEKPIVFNPSKQLLHTAQQNKWPVVVERKNVIYKLEEAHGRYILG